jgi:hypothetical protein
MLRQKWSLIVVLAGVLGASCSSVETLEPTVSGGEKLESQQQQKISVADPGIGDRFGGAVALSGDTALVGAAEDDIGGLGSDAGSAYVYRQTSSGWALEQKLVAPDGTAQSRFGSSVAIEGDTAVVSSGFNAGTAAIYVFSRSGTTWTLRKKLPSPDPTTGRFFSLSLSGARLVGVTTKAQLYFRGEPRDDASWTYEQSVSTPIASRAVVSGDLLVIGYGGEDVGANVDQGAAHVFMYSNAGWTDVQRLTASDGAPNAQFGTALAISGGTLLVGDSAGTVNGVGRGSAYAFVWSGSTWAQQQKLTAPDGAAGDQFGASLAISGDLALVGAPFHEHNGQNQNHGAAYLYARSGSTWQLKQEVRALDAQNNDNFSNDVALFGNTALIGATNDDGPIFQAQGSAYVFRFPGTLGDPCGAASDCATGFCSDGHCCDSACDGYCNACSVSTGAPKDGQCTLLPAGSKGSPSCAPFQCTGASPDCSADSCMPCEGDDGCTPDFYCAASGACQPRKALGRACELEAGADCKVAGCRVCASGGCNDGTCCGEDHCGVGVGCSANPCQNGGTCTDTPTGHTCACGPGVNGHDCQFTFTQIAASDYTFCGLRSDGKVACWGSGLAGVAKPVPPADTFTSISGGRNHYCGVRTDGSVACWGAVVAGGPPPVAFKQVTAGSDLDCGIALDDSVRCWGTSSASPPSGAFKSVALGVGYGCGIRVDDTVSCWWFDVPDPQRDKGQLTPPPNTYYRTLSLGINESCGITLDGMVLCWGAPDLGWEGGILGPFTALSTSLSYGCALRSDGLIVCRGNGGFGTTEPPHIGLPETGFRALAVGIYFGCAVRKDGIVRCWGLDMKDSPPSGMP